MKERIYGAGYIQGSAAPKRLTEVPVRIPRRQEQLSEEEIRRRRTERNVQKNRAKATRIGGLFTLLIVGAMAVVLFTFAKYISLTNQKSNNAKEISALQSELGELKESNDQKQLFIDTSIDYDYIYNVATDKLGMIYASEDQIIKYQSGESEYVMQFSEVPNN